MYTSYHYQKTYIHNKKFKLIHNLSKKESSSRNKKKKDYKYRLFCALAHFDIFMYLIFCFTRQLRNQQKNLSLARY